ncbi:hypothetical protein ACOACQ_03550 [Nocardioides sp. CPCC 206347]
MSELLIAHQRLPLQCTSQMSCSTEPTRSTATFSKCTTVSSAI